MSWINNYTPLHLDLLQSLENTINIIEQDLINLESDIGSIQGDIDNTIDSANSTRNILEELNNILDPSYIQQKKNRINNRYLRSRIITKRNNGEQVFD